jgi:hypothetical protein
MAFNSITRLRLRSLFTLAAFARETRIIAAQAAAAEGFIGGAVLAEGWMVFWTRTAWESEAAMKAFRDTGAHRASMPKLIDWCNEAMVAHWEGEPETDWTNIHARMSQQGRKSKVRKPSHAHERRFIAPMRRWSPEQPIGPTT